MTKLSPRGKSQVGSAITLNELKKDIGSHLIFLSGLLEPVANIAAKGNWFCKGEEHRPLRVLEAFAKSEEAGFKNKTPDLNKQLD